MQARNKYREFSEEEKNIERESTEEKGIIVYPKKRNKD